MSDNGNAGSGGIGFLGALTLLFIGLKLGNVIDWEWWLVLSPLWALPALALGVVTVMAVLIGLIAIINETMTKMKAKKP